MCFTGICANGVPSQPPVGAGTLCPGGFCDGSGNCVQCLTPATCPGSDGDCKHRTFANAVLMGINPFDQFGVELGKEIAKKIDKGGEGFDASTEALLKTAGLE